MYWLENVLYFRKGQRIENEKRIVLHTVLNFGIFFQFCAIEIDLSGNIV